MGGKIHEDWSSINVSKLWIGGTFCWRFFESDNMHQVTNMPVVILDVFVCAIYNKTRTFIFESK